MRCATWLRPVPVNGGRQHWTSSLCYVRAMRPEIQFTRVGVCLAEFDNDQVNVPSVRMCLCPSVTSRCSIETAERIELVFLACELPSTLNFIMTG